MELTSIKTEKCPVCGCDTVIREWVDTDFDNTKIREHCNGHHWEHRKFLCGYQIGYIPNFMAEEKEHDCQQDPELVKREEKRGKLIEAIKGLVSSTECDASFKNRVLDSLPYNY